MNRVASRVMGANTIIGQLRTRGLLPLAERIALAHHVTVEEMVVVRQGAAAAARGAMYRELRETTSLTTVDIGRIFGRDHTSVLAGLKKTSASASAWAARAALRVI